MRDASGISAGLKGDGEALIGRDIELQSRSVKAHDPPLPLLEHDRSLLGAAVHPADYGAREVSGGDPVSVAARFKPLGIQVLQAPHERHAYAPPSLK